MYNQLQKNETKNINGILVSINYETLDDKNLFVTVQQLSPAIKNRLILSGIYESIMIAKQEVEDSLQYMMGENSVQGNDDITLTTCCKRKTSCKMK